MYCPNCGKALPDLSKFCTNCGMALGQASPQPADIPPAQPYAPPAQPYTQYAQPAWQVPQPVPTVESAPVKQPKKKKLWLWITLAAVLLAGVGVGLFFLLRGGKHGGEGRYVITRYTCYDAQGNVSSKGEYRLDKNGCFTGLDRYDKDGNLEYTVEMVCDSKGNVTEQKAYTVENGEKIFDEWSKRDFHENGKPLETRELNEDGSLKFRNTYSYDADGNMTEWCYYNEDGKITDRSLTTYDEKGERLTERYLDEDGKERSLYEYENQYDADGHLIKATVYYSSAWSSEPHRLNSWTDYSYDADGRLTQTTEYDADGERDQVIKYDAEGNITEQTSYDNGRETWRTVSEYDSHGNIVKETEYYRGELEEVYVIEYQYFD